MRSLMLKLTLAFLLVGITGALLVALLVALRTRSEFDRFLSRHDQDVLLDALGVYYTRQGSWDGVELMLEGTPPLNYYSRGIALADPTGVIILANYSYRTGEVVSPDMLRRSIVVEADGEAAGYILPAAAPGSWEGRERPPSPERAFVERVTWAAAASALIAAAIALLMGGMLARTLTGPIRELTAATAAMADGQLGQQVRVRSRDEIGALASSFNRMSNDLERASRARLQMTADLAHDLRTPLSILRGYTEGLKDGRLQGAPPVYTIMHGEVEHLQRLVEDLRILSLADAGALPLNRRPVDPAALLERAALAHIVQAEQQNLELRVEAPEELPSVAVDTDRMAQVFNNLVANALHHTSSGAILLSAEQRDAYVELTVRDTGAGIVAEELPLIFDRFYRADQARRRTDGGSSGLGLAIVKAIVEAHSGSIAVASTPGAGTTFTISLPISAE